MRARCGGVGLPRMMPSEIMSLQVFQAGLTWCLVLSRCDAFRLAFKNWEIDRVARMTLQGVDRVLQDASIIRNRLRIEACVTNAHTV